MGKVTIKIEGLPELRERMREIAKKQIQEAIDKMLNCKHERLIGTGIETTWQASFSIFEANDTEFPFVGMKEGEWSCLDCGRPMGNLMRMFSDKPIAESRPPTPDVVRDVFWLIFERDL